MSDWSSFKDAKKHHDTWKKFLNESTTAPVAKEVPLDEFFFGAKKSGGKFGLSRDKNKYTADLVCKPGDDCAGAEDSQNNAPETYNADDVVALYKALDDIRRVLNVELDRAKLYDELEDLITNPQGNNYTIEEQSIHKAAVILSRMPKLGPGGNLDTKKYPNLTKVFNAALTTQKTKDHLYKILARAGFFGKEGNEIPNWFKNTKPKAPEPKPQQQQQKKEPDDQYDPNKAVQLVDDPEEEEPTPVQAEEEPEGVVGDCNAFSVKARPSNPSYALQDFLLKVRKEYQLSPEKYKELRDYIIKQSVAAGFFSGMDAADAIREVSIAGVTQPEQPRRKGRKVKGSDSQPAKLRKVDLSGIADIFADQELSQAILDCCTQHLRPSGWDIGLEAEEPAVEPEGEPEPEVEPEVEPEAEPEGEPEPEEEEEEEQEREVAYVYYLPDNFATASSTKDAYNSLWGGWKQKYRKKYKDMSKRQFKNDLDDFVDFIGPFKSEKLYEGADTIKAKIKKLADTDFLRGREQDVIKALSELPPDNGAVRILRGLKNSSSTIKAVANTVLRATKRKEKEVEASGGEVVDLEPQRRSDYGARAKDRMRSRADGAGPPFIKRVAEGESDATALNESKTIERWKTLAGLK